MSRLNQKIYRHIEARRNRAIEGEFPYVFLDGVVLKRSWAGEVRDVSVLMGIGVDADGHRQIPDVAEFARMLKAIHAQEDRRSTEAKEVVKKLKATRLAKASEFVEAKAAETLTYFGFPTNH